MKAPYLFDEFFASGLEESISPFLTPDSRRWGRNLSLKSAGFAAFFLAVAFSFSFSSPPLSNLFLSLVYFLAGCPALIAAFDDLKNFEINIDVLMTLAAFLAVMIGSGIEGALLLVLFELSHGMEETVSRKAKGALHNLNNIAPKFAHVVVEGTTFEKAVREIKIGTHLLIKQGEIVPLDGHVIEGTSSVNLVHLTGESEPVVKRVGESIAAGARVLDAALVVEVTRTSSDSTLARIIQLITAAAEAKPRVQRWLDQFGKTYATSIIVLTLIFALAIPWLISIPYLGHEGGIYRALAFMIAASPCALIIATPTAYLSSISACAKKGILLKGGITLDALATCTQIAFDKTGTLTTGDLKCTSIEPIGAVTISTNRALAIAAALERHVVHPIASSITRLAQSRYLSLPEIHNFKAIAGSGLEATLADGTPVAVGGAEFIGIQSIEGIHTFLRVGSELFVFSFMDQIRKKMPETLRNLERQGLVPLMLSGDRKENALVVGGELGIKQIFASLRPEDKLNKVAELSQAGNLAMVGDGINDAPALARATVGISLGRIGSATAVDASDVVLLNDDVSLLHWLFSQAKKTQRIVRQNIAIALGVIALATIPALLGLVPLWIAVVLHEGGTVLVGLNSLRLLKK
jgi:Cd2+/Zn2+-exporting ATPase